MSSPTWRKIAGALAAIAVGIGGAELFFLVILGMKGLPLAQFPFWMVAKADVMFAALAVFPWLLLGRSEGYGPVWFCSLLFGAGFGVIAGAMLALMSVPRFDFSLAVLLIGGMGFASSLSAATFAHVTGLFGTPQNS